MGSCVSVEVKIDNDTNSYILKPVDKGFKWGRMCDQSLSLPIALPKTTIRFGIQGRTDSTSGVESWFKYDIIHQSSNKQIASIIFKVEKPYDSIQYESVAEYTLVDQNIMDAFTVEVSTTWGGTTFTHSHVNFKLSVNASKLDELEAFIKRENQPRFD